MSQPYVGEIRMFAGNFAPDGWMLCQGQVLEIVDYGTLFSLIGTTYGGDGQQTFALPDLRGRVPVASGTAAGLSPYVIGQVGGQETVTLQVAQIPAHSHAYHADAATASAAYTPAHPTGNASIDLYGAKGPDNGAGGGYTVMNAAASAPAGSGLAHENMGPFLCVNFIISLYGVFPSQA